MAREEDDYEEVYEEEPTQGERQQGLVKIDSYIGCVEERVSGCMG